MQSSQQNPIVFPAWATVTFASLLCSDMTAQYWLDTASDALACVAGPVVGVMSTSTSPVVGVEPPGVEGVVSTRASQPIIALDSNATANIMTIHFMCVLPSRMGEMRRGRDPSRPHGNVRRRSPVPVRLAATQARRKGVRPYFL